MVTDEFLKSLVQERNLSAAEAEVLFRAFANKSIEDIATDLQISANAVRKRLGEAYDKIGVPGKGPGKLAKLQQMLLSKYQAQTTQRVLLWWSSNDGKQLAESLKNTILSYPQLETRVCNTDPMAGEAWRLEIGQNLAQTDYAIGCFTDGNSENPWVNFAAGFLSGKVGNKFIRFGQKLRFALGQVVAIDGKNQEELAQMLQEITNSEAKKAKEWVEFKFPQWQKELKQLLEKPMPFEADIIVNAIRSIKEAENRLITNDYIRDNTCFKSIILNSITETSKQLVDATFGYCIPAVLYPQRLVNLQQEFKACVSAVAIVGNQERFWLEAIGREICQTSHSESVRIFVLTIPEDFDRYFDILLEHASQYNVYVISYKIFARKFRGFVRNFGIIEVEESRVFAEYTEENSQQLKYKRFSADPQEVDLHKAKIDEMIQSSDTISITNLWKEALEKAFSNGEPITIVNFEIIQKLDKIREWFRTDIRRRIFV